MRVLQEYSKYFLQNLDGALQEFLSVSVVCYGILMIVNYNSNGSDIKKFTLICSLNFVNPCYAHYRHLLRLDLQCPTNYSNF